MQILILNRNWACICHCHQLICPSCSTRGHSHQHVDCRYYTTFPVILCLESFLFNDPHPCFVIWFVYTYLSLCIRVFISVIDTVTCFWSYIFFNLVSSFLKLSCFNVNKSLTAFESAPCLVPFKTEPLTIISYITI